MRDCPRPHGGLPLFIVLLLGVLPLIGFSQTLLVTSGNTVRSYDATTGTLINSSYITGTQTFDSLAIAGSHVFVTSRAANSIGKYNLSDGSVVNASFISDTDVYALAASGTDLYASHFSNDVISKFNAANGATISSTFLPVDQVISVHGLAVADAGLLVSDAGYYHIRRFNPTTGAFIDAFITDLNQPRGIAVSGGYIYIVNQGTNSVRQYNATTGALVNGNFITAGLSDPFGIAVAGSDLYVTNHGSDKVMRFNAMTGALIDANFITGLSDPSGIAIAAIPEPTTYAMLAGLLALSFVAVRRRRTNEVRPVRLAGASDR